MSFGNQRGAPNVPCGGNRPAPASQNHNDLLKKVEWESSEVRQSTGPDLTSSAVISGGRALKSSENFKPLEELADVLGGAEFISPPQALKNIQKTCQCAN